jgi:cytochrome c peroxidase
MNMTLADVSARVGLTSDGIARALASYVRSILSGNSRFDRFVDGDRRALSPEEREGLRVFRGKGDCTSCHVGPNFTDERFHNTGIAWRDGSMQDEGRSAVTGKPEDRGAFKTPTLREIARTAPYMHDGTLVSLDDVVEYYDRGGNSSPGLDPELRPLKLTASDKRALVAFLHALSGVVSGR